MAVQAQSRATRRRRREDVRSEVRRVTLSLAEETPFRDLTVDEIAREAGLSRSAFYFYFRDKHDLLMAAAEEIADDLYREADRWWHGDGPPKVRVREALERVVSIYAEHVGLMRVATEVATYDEEVGEFWDELMGRFITATAEHLERERAAGRVPGDLNAETTAESLVWMAERSCYMYLGRGERSVREVVDSLLSVWLRALYPATGSSRE